MVEITTRQRILDTSAALFNIHGLDSVTIGQISDALGISTGNLTYHFPRKSDLIRVHVNEFCATSRDNINNFPLVSPPRIFASAYINLVLSTLRYRFLFSTTSSLENIDAESAQILERSISEMRQTYIGYVKSLIDAGMMKPVMPPYSAEMLVDCTRMQWTGWLTMNKVHGSTKESDDICQAAKAVLQILFVCHHYISEDFFREVQAELDIACSSAGKSYALRRT